MNSNSTIGPMPTTVCQQPDCPLRKANINSAHLAEIIVQVLAGEPSEKIIPEGETIHFRPHCPLCAQRVMRGGKAFLTQAEWDHLNEMGQWRKRRQRRSTRNY